MKICCFLINVWQEPLLKEKLKNHELKIFSKPLNKNNLNEIKDCEILVSRARFLDLKFDETTLKKIPNLKFIATMSTGFDHIDLNYCKKNNILVSNVPKYGETSVAEQTFALILAIIKKIPQSIENTKKGIFSQENLQGQDLHGKTLGVIGSGNIGLNVIKIAKSFGMKIIAYDIVHNKEACKELDFFYIDELNDLLKDSDIITFHAPYNKYTHHLLNEENLFLLKKSAIIINTARGELIDTHALINYLEKGNISFAGLDVFEEDNPGPVERLIKSEKVFITPHNASNTLEAKRKILEITIENIESFIKNYPINLIKNSIQ